MDKLLILRFYSQPPNYNAAIPQTIASILPFGTIIHMAIALYMMSNRELMYEGDSVYYKRLLEKAMSLSGTNQVLLQFVPRVLVRENVIALLAVFVTFAAYQAMKWIFGKQFDVVLASMSKSLCSCKWGDAAVAFLRVHKPPPRPPYSETYRAQLTRNQLHAFEATGSLKKADTALGMAITDDMSKKSITATNLPAFPSGVHTRPSRPPARAILPTVSTRPIRHPRRLHPPFRDRLKVARRWRGWLRSRALSGRREAHVGGARLHGTHHLPLRRATSRTA